MREQSTGRSPRFAFVLVFAAVVCSAPSSAFASTAHQYEKSFGPDGTSTTQFVYPGAVAVDEASHDVYVADLNPETVSKFDENGTPVEFTAGPGKGSNDIGGFGFISAERGTSQIAVDNSCSRHNPPLTELTTPTCAEFDSSNGNFYAADLGNQVIEAFHADGEEAEFTAGLGSGSNEIPTGEVCGVAVDANGAIYAGEYGTGVHIFAPSGEELTSFAVSEPCNVAVDSHGAVYVAQYASFVGSVEKFIPSVFPVIAATEYPSPGTVVDPGPAYAIAVDPASDELYVVKHPALEKSDVVQYNENGQIEGEFGETGPGALKKSEGITVDGTTEKVYASDAAGEHQVEIFAPPPAVPPSVESTTATNLTATSADLQAKVNPKFFDTHYHFEYLTEAEYHAGGETFSDAQSTPETDARSGGVPQIAQAHLGGLTPDTAYRFRVVAENENGKTTSAEPPPRFSTFPAFSPGLPDGRAYEMVSPPQKAGEVLTPTVFDFTCSGCVPAENDARMPMQTALDGEVVVYEGQPFAAGLAAGPNAYLSGRSSSGWGTQFLSSPLFGSGGGQGYQGFSSDLSRGVLYQVQPALSPEAPTRGGKSFANLYLRDESGFLKPLVTKVPEGPGHRSPGESPNSFGLIYAGANAGTASAPAFGHVVFEANDALTEAVEKIAPEAPEIAAEEKNLYEWAEGQLRLVNVLPGNAEAAAGAVIGSGRLLGQSPTFEARDVDHAISDDGSRVFWSEEETGQVYVRIDGEETLEVPGPGRCKETLSLAERVCFLTASADGSQVLLSDGQIYELNEEGEAYEPATDLTDGQGGFQGVLGTSEDLSHVYFVDTEALTEESEKNANEEHSEAGKFNLYASHEGATAFIGVLLAADNEVGGSEFGDWHASRANRTAQVSADGSHLAFMSQAPLTGYDNTLSGGGECPGNSGSGPACYEVFDYEAANATLTCASCSPTAQRPLGPSRLSLIQPTDRPFRQPENLNADGRLFFASQDVLSPQDTNGHIQDVYEWEPNGLGSCKRPGGCVFLISSGHGHGDSFFLDSTPSGNDAFIVTREQLLPQDKNDQFDLYDARAPHMLGEQVGFPEGETAPCGGDACKGPIANPLAQPGAGSSEFSGPPNPKHVCPKGKVRKNGKCVRKKHHKRHHKRAAKHNRGGDR